MSKNAQRSQQKSAEKPEPVKLDDSSVFAIDRDGNPMTADQWTEKVVDRTYYLVAIDKINADVYYCTLWHGLDYGGLGNLYVTYRLPARAQGDGPDWGSLTDPECHVEGYRSEDRAAAGHTSHVSATLRIVQAVQQSAAEKDEEAPGEHEKTELTETVPPEPGWAGMPKPSPKKRVSMVSSATETDAMSVYGLEDRAEAISEEP